MVALRSIQDSFDEWLRELPEARRALARRLPFRLGITQDEQGGWEDFIVLEPNRILPWYAAQVPHHPSLCLLGGARLDGFLRAHHAAGFHGLLCDRLDDAQVACDLELLELRAELLSHWRATLGSAIQDQARADEIVSGALHAMRRGTHLEGCIRKRSTLRARYGMSTALKLDWILVSARALLEVADNAGRAARFAQLFRLVLLALQCRDDVVDADEDQRLHGVSMPSALGLSGTALLHTADHLLRRAEQRGRRAGFTRLADWIATEALPSTAQRARSSSVQDGIAGLFLSWALEDDS